MIYKELTKGDFRDEFHRSTRNDQFTYTGLGTLYDYLVEGENYELDIIELCCEWTEYNSSKEAVEDYSSMMSADNSFEHLDEEGALSWLRERTTVLESFDSILLQEF